MQGEKGPQRKANGVLQVPAAQATNDKPHAPKSSRSKAPEGDKVVIRRLPPGLTEEEFWEHLGPQWKAGAGLVVWAQFKSGKVSQDPAKSSKPGRAYLHVAKRDSLAELSDTVQTKAWEDAKLTHNNPCLVGPPVLEFSIYKRAPGMRKRPDQRQGTIDQDPEFMSFLQSLTNPEPEKEAASSDEKLAAEDAEMEAKVTTTPLIEYLREKKANKAKDAAAAKSAKQASKSKGGSAATAAEEPNKKSKKDKDKDKDRGRERDREKDKDKDAKASKSPEKPKDNVKILTKRAATVEAAKAAENAANQINAAQEAPKSRRANITAAARILQRDLGMSPGSAHRKARLNAAKSEAEAKTASSVPAEAATSPATESVPAAAPSSTSATAAATTSEQPAERPPTPTASKSGRSRRGGGKGANANEGKGKAAESSGSKTSSPAPAKPVVLLKKKDPDAISTATPASQPEPQPESAPPTTKKNTSSSAANQPSGSKGSSGKASASAKKSSAAVTPGATRAFVKHANPSQGITESALKQTFETFGAVTSVEVDRRKGFAYVDFSDHDALAKAVGASPVSVAQGAVQVMERKDKKGAGASAGGGSSNSKENSEAAAASSGAGASSPAPPPASEKPENTGSGSGRRNRRGRGGGGGGGNKSTNAKGSAGESKPAASAG